MSCTLSFHCTCNSPLAISRIKHVSLGKKVEFQLVSHCAIYCPCKERNCHLLVKFIFFLFLVVIHFLEKLIYGFLYFYIPRDLFTHIFLLNLVDCMHMAWKIILIFLIKIQYMISPFSLSIILYISCCITEWSYPL